LPLKVVTRLAVGKGKPPCRFRPRRRHNTFSKLKLRRENSEGQIRAPGEENVVWLFLTICIK